MEIINKKTKAIMPRIVVIIILLIVGFGILLLIYSQISWTGEIDRSVCYQSVIMRATLPDTLNVKNLPPLKCKTRKVCITDKIFGKGDCTDLGEKYDTVRVSGTNEKQQEQINKFIAGEMVDCWGTMGEGKVQIFTRQFEFLKSNTRACVVCSRISFDSSIQDSFEKGISGLGDYMFLHKIPNKEISYWDYITNNADFSDYGKNGDKYTTKQKAILFIESDKTDAPTWIGSVFGSSWLCLPGAKVGAFFGSIIPGGGTVGGALLGCIIGGATGAWGGEKVGEVIESQIELETQTKLAETYIKNRLEDSDYASGNLFMDYDSSELKKLECDSFENIP